MEPDNNKSEMEESIFAFDLFDWISIVIIILMAVPLLIYGWKKLKPFLMLEGSFEEADQKFLEAELANVAGYSSERGHFQSEEKIFPPEKEESRHEKEGHGPALTPPFMPQKKEVTEVKEHDAGGDIVKDPEDLFNRLTRLAVVSSREGKIPLAKEPHGIIASLKRGGFCALMPYTPSEEELVYLTTRFDMVFHIGRKGEVLIAERFQHRLPELLDVDRLSK